MPHKNTVLLLSHVHNDGVAALHAQLLDDCQGELDVIFLADNSRGLFSGRHKDPRFFLFTVDDLKNLEYPGRSRLFYPWKPEQRNAYHRERNFRMGVTELPVLHYYLSTGSPMEKDRYFWVIEHDVRFTGNWKSFFRHFNASSSDLLTTSLVDHSRIPEWPRWSGMQIPGSQPEARQGLKGFFPIYRISTAALDCLHRAYLEGATGHYECLLPTVLGQAGMALEDIGGDGRFTREENINRFYQNHPEDQSLAPGTFVFRPTRKEPGDKPDTLWHPVKSN